VPDDALCFQFDQAQMSLEEAARLIHKIVTQLLMATNTEASPEVIDQTPSDQMAGYFNSKSDKFTNVTLGIVVGHVNGRQGKILSQ